MKQKNELAVLGLGVMGAALAKNFMSRGFQVALFNRTYATTQTVEAQSNGKGIAYETLDALVDSLETPRKLFFMLPAGAIVDEHIELLKPLLSKGDIIMDGGNSFFKDSRRRSQYCKELGLNFFGVGVSGGEQGALLGPSIMPGGERASYESIRPYLEKISAKKGDEACCTFIGEDGAGHYVKMVHNGIEYADMQLIAEIYLFFKTIQNKGNAEIAEIFEAWNKTEVKSYLIEISAAVLSAKDPESAGDLVDFIQDAASQKGTGTWTSVQSFELGVDVAMITSALQARIVSNLTKERGHMGAILGGAETNGITLPEMSVESVRQAYYLAKIVAYAQGFAMMSEAAQTYGWGLDLAKIASIFRAGCIIQADFLEVIMDIYKSQPNLENLLLHPQMQDVVVQSLGQLRTLHLNAVANALPTPSVGSALLYLDQLRAPLLGANLIQGQRDYFGAHTFRRTDREGVFHHDWS